MDSMWQMVYVWQPFCCVITSTLQWSVLNPCKYQSNSSQNHSLMTMTFYTKPKIDLLKWELGKACMDFNRLISWPPTAEEKVNQIRILWIFTYTRSMEVPLKTDPFHTGCWWLWPTYVNIQDKKCLLNSLKDNCKVEIDWASGPYCGIMLDLKYYNRHIDISIPGYIKKQLQKYEHFQKGPTENGPYPASAKNYWNAPLVYIPEATTNKLSKDKKNGCNRILPRL